jgi:methylenetetrahydrofolate dehydrogenase (NADP+) / methenyltetrahydrofolate cyclohydrolase
VSAVVIDGKAIAASVRADVKAEIEARGLRAGLATVLIGDDPASAVYVAGKIRACEEVGIESIHHALTADVPEAEVVALIGELNERADVSGVLLQLPVPEHLDGQMLTALIDPDKDVDGLTPVSAGRLLQNRPGLRPCTPAGVLELLDRHSVELEGAEVVVVGRSDLVGRPVAQLLLHRNATVTMCHSRTRDLAAECRRADVLVAAVGHPRLVQGDWVKPGAAVIDVGINRTDEGLVGDVDFDAAAERAALITPVPGGVGPMTIAMLVRNTVAAALQKTAPREGGSGG